MNTKTKSNNNLLIYILAGVGALVILAVAVVVISNSQSSASGPNISDQNNDGLPDNWDDLTAAQKVALNPFNCSDPALINVNTGQCLGSAQADTPNVTDIPKAEPVITTNENVTDPDPVVPTGEDSDDIEPLPVSDDAVEVEEAPDLPFNSQTEFIAYMRDSDNSLDDRFGAWSDFLHHYDVTPTECVEATLTSTGSLTIDNNSSQTMKNFLSEWNPVFKFLNNIDENDFSDENLKAYQENKITDRTLILKHQMEDRGTPGSDFVLCQYRDFSFN